MPRRSRRSRRRLRAHLIQAGFVLAVIALWYWTSTRGMVNPLIVPALPQVWDEFTLILARGSFWPDLRITLGELCAGYAIAVACGCSLGYLISQARYAIRAFDPMLAGLAATPVILIYPLYVMFFGIGMGSKIALGATIGFFPIVLSTIAGFGSVEALYIKAARSMGASNVQMFRYVLLPAAFPVVLGGLRIGFIVTFLSILGGETLTSFSGLGHQIVALGEMMDTAKMYGYIVFVVVIAALLNVTVTALERRWRRAR
jgi:ABC-type nitrate/sulfonate/bicarbonate transport system permease component